MVEMKGEYVRSSAENYDKFLDALGLKEVLRNPDEYRMVVVEHGHGQRGWWTISWTDGFLYDSSVWLFACKPRLKFHVVFVIGEKFDEKTADGREVETLVERDGNKLITTQTAKKAGEKSTRSTLEFFEDRCVYTMEILDTDIVCTQTFTRKSNPFNDYVDQPLHYFLDGLRWDGDLMRFRSDIWKAKAMAIMNGQDISEEEMKKKFDDKVEEVLAIKRKRKEEEMAEEMEEMAEEMAEMAMDEGPAGETAATAATKARIDNDN